MFGQKAKKITQLSSDVESFKSLHKKELAARESLQAFVRDIRVQLGAQENEHLFDVIAKYKSDNQSLQSAVERLNAEMAQLQGRLEAAVSANLASNTVKPKVKRAAKRKKG